MRLSRMAMAIALSGLLTGGTAYAQQGTTYGLRQPTSVTRTAYEYADYYADDTHVDPPAAAAPSYGGGCCDTCGNGCCDGCCGDGCGDGCCGAADDPGFRLFGFLDCWGLMAGGWVNPGFTYNTREPASRFNGVTTFNDRDEEAQLNQLWLFAGREADTGGYGVDIGGRMDLIYGTDHRFTTAVGLEDNWNNERFYGLAMPQLYAEFAVNDLSVIVGHFFTIIGYEVVPAPDNFFYSHAYTMQYGEPFTHTGMLARYALSDAISISGGLHRGWDMWEDDNNNLGFLGGITLDSGNGLSLAYACTYSPEVVTDANDDILDDDAGRWMNSIVAVAEMGNLTYVFQHDLGIQRNGNVVGTAAVGSAQWYGVNQYLFYALNDTWSIGMRAEWFRDDDGTRVGGFASGNPNTGPFVGDFYEFTWGLNWKPNANVVWRGEMRWDFFDNDVAGSAEPFADGSKDNQLLLATDVIFLY